MGEAANPLAWPALYAAVNAFFLEESFDCESYFGWRGPSLKAQTLRKISWVPGDPSGSVGKLLPPVQVEEGRSLATLEELFTIYVYACDNTALENEEAQYTAARLLFDTWFRGVYHAAGRIKTRGRLNILSSKWETRKKERPHGACLIVLTSLQARIIDETPTFAHVGTTAELTGDLVKLTGDPEQTEFDSIGDVEETQTIPEEET